MSVIKLIVEDTTKEITDFAVNIQNRQSEKECIRFSPKFVVSPVTKNDMFPKELKKYLGLHLQ